MQKTGAAQHTLILENRNSMRISGVKDIAAFNDSRIILSTVMGELTIRGDDLHVSSLEEPGGDLTMTGNVRSIVYSRFRSSDNLVGKLFR